MERESFEDPVTAEFLNAHFVSIKVDREERPDIDKIYMTAVQTLTGQGGWPLNCVLTPDLKPFFGGTYFPPQPRYGRPSFLEVLGEIDRVWRERREDVAAAAADLVDKIRDRATGSEMAFLPELATVTQAAALFMTGYDAENGGFGGAPKFPCPSVPQFLLRYAARFGDQEAVAMVMTTCDRMAAGGICDQLGGGFHRYSVDAQWLVPHFEKMLYDNAQLVQLYLDVFVYSHDGRHADVARETLDYVLRDMTHPDGGFYSAEDADSEGKEGKFYCWTRKELAALLEPGEFQLVVRRFGITESGNFTDHSDPDALAGQNILSLVDPALEPHEQPILAAACDKLRLARSKRVRPHLDDKILASWNGMMLGAMARASMVLNEPKYLAAAEKNLNFIQRHLWSAETGALYHRWRDGARDSVQLLDAYANLIAGVIDLYEATLNPERLEFAVALADSMVRRFQDTESGGFFQSELNAPDLILNVKSDYDGAEPSGNSVAALALLKLACMTDRADFREAGLGVLKWLHPRLESMPQAVPHLLHAVDFSLQEPRRVVLTGNPHKGEWKELLKAVHAFYQPNKVVMSPHGVVEEFVKTWPERSVPQVCICSGTTCHAPVTSVGEVPRLLLTKPGAAN